MQPVSRRNENILRVNYFKLTKSENVKSENEGAAGENFNF